MRQRSRRRRRRGRAMRASRRRGRTRDGEPAIRQNVATSCRHTDKPISQGGNEPCVVDCQEDEVEEDEEEANLTDMNLWIGQQSVESAGSRGMTLVDVIKTTRKQSNVRVIGRDGARQLSADLSRRARHARTNFATLILFALTALLSYCHFDPNPSTSSSTWQVRSQTLEMPPRQNEKISPPPRTIVIRTQQGQLFRGSRWPGMKDGDAVEFLSLRYASAPVKRLRFMPPTPFTYAKGPLHDFTQSGPICMQKIPLDVSRAQRNLIGQYLGNPATNETINNRLELMLKTLLASTSENDRLVRSKLGRFVQSEDCLNLNIYTPLEALDRGQVVAHDGAVGPRTDDKDTREQQSDASERQQTRAFNNANSTQLPVLVLVHGHSFDFGSGSLLEAREFARDNRLVVITLNYRLNILGFPPKFGAASRANLGLLDQVAALHWIRANIRSFGGAPENVTLMGHKRGAILVHLLMLSPLAKGLFQRAILEDGTALSPVVANNLLAGNSQQQQQQQVALMHLRALAYLCSCPLSSAAFNSSNLADKSHSNSGGGGSGSELEQRATINSLVFECLRSKPSELLVQHIPSDLIDLNRLAHQTPGGLEHHQVLPIASKWRAPLERLTELLSKERLKRRLEVATGAANEFNGSDQSAASRVDQPLGELNRLLESSGGQLAIRADKLNRLAALLVVKLGEHRNERRLSELIADVLSALYLPSNETLPIGPVFAPQLELGTLVSATPTHDDPLPESNQLANAMLQRDSPFGQRDLMIGLTAPLIEQQDAFLSIQNSRHHHRDLPLERPQAGRLSELGLSEEQAIGQVNLFVRSFYRFHQQEISNSIVNQYLGNNNLQFVSDTNVESNEIEEQAKVMARRKQLFLLKSLQELYVDALVLVPMLKTALIHSLRQLDSLADLFVTQQLDRMQAITDEEGGHAANSLWDGQSGVALNQLLEARQLQENFYTFVRGFYRASSVWPIGLQPPVNVSTNLGDTLDIRAPRSTFLYQFASSSPAALKTKLSHRLQFVLTQLERHAIARGRHRSTLQELKAVLMKVIDEINSSQAQADDEFQFNFSCSFNDWNENEPSLLRKLNFWICREQIGKTLASFVRTGNANEAHWTSESEEFHQDNKEIRARLERYQSECIIHQLERVNNQDHLVQLTSEAAGTSNKKFANYEILVEQPLQRDELKTYSCRNKIQSLAFGFLMKFKFLQESHPRPQDWPVFNVFGQQLANFNLSATGPPTNLAEYSLESFASSSSSQRELFDSKVAFWANFIPALNCSRTQPIGAQSLSLFSQANSTLLNMNLNFNCQQQQQQQQQLWSNSQHLVATKTADSLLQSMLARIRHELTERKRARQRSLLDAANELASSLAGSNSTSPNHHLPRMANMSTSQQVGGQLDEMVADSTHSTTTTNNNNNNNNQGGYLPQNWLTAVGGGATSSPASLARRAFAFISRQSASVAFWLLSAVFLLSILVVLVSGLAVARQWKSVRARLRKRRTRKRQTNGGTSGDTSEHSPASLQLDASHLQGLEIQANQQLRHQTSSLVSQNDADETNFCQQQVSSSTSFMTTPPQVHQQDSDPLPGSQILLPPPMLTDGLAGESPSGGEYQMPVEQQHLPTCKLMTTNNENHQVRQQTGAGALLTSSTSSETTNGRAHSSVSLVSTSGTLTNNGNSNCAATRDSVASAATIKKRVKISDPKRRPRSPESHGDFGRVTPLSMYPDSGLYCPLHRAGSTNMSNFITTDLNQQQPTNNTNNHYQESHMTRSASSYYDQFQRQQQQLEQFDQYRAVCPAHENYDQEQQQQQQQQQQLMLMNQLYLASANNKTNSLYRR